MRGSFKIRSRNAFFCCFFDNVTASCTCNFKHWASERTLSYATLQCIAILLTLDIIQVTWLFDVRSSSSSVRKGLHQQRERYLQKFIKWCNSHAQLTTWCSRCDESKHDEVAFQLAAADFGSSSLWQTYLKDNSWMCILHQYHKVSGLKAWTAMCRSEEKWGNRAIFKMAGDMFVGFNNWLLTPG